MAEEDLKKLNYEEWKKQIRKDAYLKMFRSVFWGLIVLSVFISDYPTIYARGFRWSNVFVAILGIGFIVWGIFGLRRDIKRIQKLD